MASNARDVERNVFILDEAKEEELDWGDEDDEDEDLAAREEAERARQKAESVLLRDRTERTMLQEVVSRWEERLDSNQQNPPIATETPQSFQRRRIRPLPRPSQSPASSPSPHPAPAPHPSPSEHLGDSSLAAPEAKLPPPALPAYLPPSEDSGELLSSAGPEAQSTSPTLTAIPEAQSMPPTFPAPTPENSGDVARAAPSPAPSAPAPSSEGSGDVTLAAPEAKMPSPPTPVRSPGPPAPPPSSEGSEHVTPTAPEAKIQSP
ncbi:hypothetical protein EV360DRAFT_91083, partial [Lentinula raphanica]